MMRFSATVTPPNGRFSPMRIDAASGAMLAEWLGQLPWAALGTTLGASNVQVQIIASEWFGER
jgi:hypothetical protein